jgi:carboxyl-terminal processing protease
MDSPAAAVSGPTTATATPRGANPGPQAASLPCDAATLPPLCQVGGPNSMRLLDACRWVSAALLLVIGTARGIQAGDGSSAHQAVSAASVEADANEALRQALELERQHRWADAILSYERALERWPGQVEFRHRLRLCEAHFRLNRRYQDRSFRDVLLQLPRAQALDLYDEILERISSHYVEPVALEPLLRRGFDNLEVALRDPAFLKVNAPEIPPDRIKWLRHALLSRRQQVVARTRADARGQVIAACEAARLAASITPAAVVLEFTYGACDALDDYSSYLTPDRLDDLYAMIDGNFVGLGVELKSDADGLVLVSVLRGGPADEAGLKPGDRITHINGAAVKGLDLDTAANRLQGASGSLVRVTVLRADATAETLELTRREVEVRSVADARIVDPQAHVGYIQLTGFQKSSTEELKAAVESLRRQGMRHLVLDLRGNPGGLLNIAIDIADRFLDQGVIVSTRGRAPGQSAVYRARPDGAWTMPVIVLIDHDSASASEILAGALQDNGRARVVGQKSYGKGSVQSIFPLRSVNAGLKLTTARFYSPRDRSYSEQGVDPDLVVTTSARPSDGNTVNIAELAAIGDPQRDPVLKAALRLARGE